MTQFQACSLSYVASMIWHSIQPNWDLNLLAVFYTVSSVLYYSIYLQRWSSSGELFQMLGSKL